MPPEILHLLWIVPLAVLVFYLGSPRYLGTIAPSRVGRLLNAMLDKSRYSVLHDLILPAGGGTVHVDHVVVSRAGIFVLDSLYLAGRVSGTEVQDRWKDEQWFYTRRLDNPVHANRLKIQVLERLLGLPPSRFSGLVVVCGHQSLAPGVPAGVIAAGHLVAKLRAASREVLSAEEADEALRKLHQLSLKTPRGRLHGKRRLLRAVLFLILVGGVAAVYHDQLTAVYREVQARADQRMAPENFHPDGQPKTAREVWEDRLVCALSVDTGSCACYEPGGNKADLSLKRCRELAERGSVLKQ